MANVIRCAQGHYYDSSIYGECPHCETNPLTGMDLHTRRQMINQCAIEYLKEKTGGSSSVKAASSDLVKCKNGHLYDSSVYDECPYCKKKWTEEPMTTGVRPSANDWFVTGWVVATIGPDRGHSYNLSFGYNTIGYGRNNQVRLLADPSLPHLNTICSIVYADKTNRFYLVPESGREIALNGKRVSLKESRENQTPELSSGDLITFGSTGLIFIPFCNDMIRWTQEDISNAMNSSREISGGFYV